MLTQQAKAERDDFMRIVERQKIEEVNERKLEEDKKNAMAQHKTCLSMQIEKNSISKSQQRLDYLEEGKKTRQKLEEQR